MQEKLLKIFQELELDYKELIVQTDSSNNIFQCVMKAAFAKSYEFNCLCNNLSNPHDSFFLMASLRGICEDLISIKYLKEKITIDRELLLSLLVRKGTFEGIIVQRNFFKENKPEQIIIDNENADELFDKLSIDIKSILIKNGLKGDKEFPSVAQMATDTKLIKLYNYLYYATSKLVHFSPGLLMRLGWAENMTSTTFKFSTKNFHKYYYDFNSYYAAFIFIEFYKAFKKDLELGKKFKGQIKQIVNLLDDQLRMPEIVTFEECNMKPPSVITQLLLKSTKRLSGK